MLLSVALMVDIVLGDVLQAARPSIRPRHQLSRQPRLNLNMPQGLVARELLARGVEDFWRRCV